MPRFKNQYHAEGKEIRAKIREESGHRCIRCGHPFLNGQHGRGEWSPCDKECHHAGPIRFWGIDSQEWTEKDTHIDVSFLLAPPGVRIEAKWRVLTVHHFDGDKANDRWWNTLSLCQRCHLSVQSRVNPEIPYFFEHSEWLKPYVAGFYAFKYLNEDLTREEVAARLDELLFLECRTSLPRIV